MRPRRPRRQDRDKLGRPSRGRQRTSVPTLEMRAWHAELLAETDDRHTVSAGGRQIPASQGVRTRATYPQDRGRLLDGEEVRPPVSRCSLLSSRHRCLRTDPHASPASRVVSSRRPRKDAVRAQRESANLIQRKWTAERSTRATEIRGRDNGPDEPAQHEHSPGLGPPIVRRSTSREIRSGARPTTGGHSEPLGAGRGRERGAATRAEGVDLRRQAEATPRIEPCCKQPRPRAVGSSALAVPCCPTTRWRCRAVARARPDRRRCVCTALRCVHGPSQR